MLKGVKQLHNVHTEKIGECNISYMHEYIGRKLSIVFPYFFNHILTSYLQEKQDNVLGLLFDKIYKQDFYNNYNKK